MIPQGVRALRQPPAARPRPFGSAQSPTSMRQSFPTSAILPGPLRVWRRERSIGSRLAPSFIQGLDIFVGGLDKNAETKCLAIASRLREEHLLTPDLPVSTTPVLTTEHS
jgi:hypothetical protein